MSEPIKMFIETIDSATKEKVKTPISVSSTFSDPRSYLESLVKQFDQILRTTVSGNYNLTIESDYLTADKVNYSFNDRKKDCFGHVDTTKPYIIIEGSVERDRLTFDD